MGAPTKYKLFCHPSGVVLVTNLVLFLASDESSFITGTEHIIDGGMTAQ
ncbi:SDR family oxidoreductase [Terriglobus tenax]